MLMSRRQFQQNIGSINPGGGSIIKSITPVSFNMSGVTSQTASLPNVNVGNSVIILDGAADAVATNKSNQQQARVELTNATTATCYLNTSPGVDAYMVYATVIEYYPGVLKSVQAGTIVVNPSQNETPSNTATISSVNTAKAKVIYLGATNNLNNTASGGVLSATVLTNPTTVTAYTSAAVTNGIFTVGYMVMEHN